jgi:single-strand DNA-binding protein
MNNLSVTGRLTRDSELRFLKDGKPVLSFSLANNTGYGDSKKTNYFECSLFGKCAEGKLHEYLKKGQEVAVSGEVSLNEYKSASGENKASLRVRVNDVTLVGASSAAVPAKPEAMKENKTYGYQRPDNFDDVPF